MIRKYGIISILAVTAMLLVSGCGEETAELKEKIATLEKKMQKQETDLRDFAGKIGPPRDFSADIQRLEDQQEKFGEALKGRIDPVNSKLEEFREWAQDAQKDREVVAKKLKSLDQSVAELHKEIQKELHKKPDSDKGEAARIGKELTAQKKSMATLSQNLDELSKNVAEIRREVLENNTKLVNAVKKTLPKVKDAAVAELKDRLAPLETGLSELKTGLKTDRSPGASPRQASLSTETSKEIQALNRKARELEEVVTAQKAYLLEMGTKVHSLEVQLRQALEQ
jgi:chromosome segregation ATPase